MFPETIQEGDEIPSTQMMSNQQTNLQRLSQPAQILKSALSSLATYQVSESVCVCMSDFSEYERGERELYKAIFSVANFIFLCPPELN